jgi:hypothetical protein
LPKLLSIVMSSKLLCADPILKSQNNGSCLAVFMFCLSGNILRVFCADNFTMNISLPGLIRLNSTTRYVLTNSVTYVHCRARLRNMWTLAIRCVLKFFFLLYMILSGEIIILIIEIKHFIVHLCISHSASIV